MTWSGEHAIRGFVPVQYLQYFGIAVYCAFSVILWQGVTGLLRWETWGSLLAVGCHDNPSAPRDQVMEGAASLVFTSQMLRSLLAAASERLNGWNRSYLWCQLLQAEVSRCIWSGLRKFRCRFRRPPPPTSPPNNQGWSTLQYRDQTHHTFVSSVVSGYCD